jgi:amidophosphoribosyltransferase
MVYSVRMQCGRVLAKETGIEADLVSSVPESGTAAAHGYSQEVRCFAQYLFATLIS